MLLAIYDCTQYRTVLFLHNKMEAADQIQKQVAQIECQYGKAPRWMRFNNETKLVNKKVKSWAAQKGITIKTTAPHSPSQHGAVEHFNWTILELACAMLIAKNLPTFLWDKAVADTIYLWNQVPTWVLQGMTPYKAWNGKKPDISHLREFGCDIWVLNEFQNRSKLSPKLKKMIFVGFMDGSKSIWYYDPSTCKIKVSCNVAFNNNEKPRELEIMMDILGLPVEGEIGTISELLSLPYVVRPESARVRQSPPESAGVWQSLAESGGLWRTPAGLNWTKPDSPASAKSVYWPESSPVESCPVESYSRNNRNIVRLY